MLSHGVGLLVDPPCLYQTDGLFQPRTNGEERTKARAQSMAHF